MDTDTMLDLFPATVTGPDIHWRQARVHIDGDRIRVWTRAGRKIEAAADRTYVGWEHDGRRTYTVTLDDETGWTVTVGGGCGCGNPLRSASVAELP